MRASPGGAARERVKYLSGAAKDGVAGQGAGVCACWGAFTCHPVRGPDRVAGRDGEVLLPVGGVGVRGDGVVSANEVRPGRGGRRAGHAAVLATAVVVPALVDAVLGTAAVAELAPPIGEPVADLR